MKSIRSLLIWLLSNVYWFYFIIILFFLYTHVWRQNVLCVLTSNRCFSSTLLYSRETSKSIKRSSGIRPFLKFHTPTLEYTMACIRQFVPFYVYSVVPCMYINIFFNISILFYNNCFSETSSVSKIDAARVPETVPLSNIRNG